MSFDPSKPFVPPPGPDGVPIACGACLPHNIAVEVTGIHAAPGGVYLHLLCSNGHRQRLGIRAEGGRVLLDLEKATPPASSRPGEVMH